jgi:hypothetical protein
MTPCSWPACLLLGCPFTFAGRKKNLSMLLIHAQLGF